MGLAKFRETLKPRDEWPFAYRLLPETEHDRLTRFLAATWMLAHSDLHRGNLGLLISHPEDGPKQVRIAPAYDVSSAAGTNLSSRLEFPIAHQADTTKIGMPQWVTHAKSCAIDETQTLLAVSEVAQALPDAFAQARIGAYKQRLTNTLPVAPD